MSSTVERKLAAIMFTDIAGYTAQMSEDESKAMELLNKKELSNKKEKEIIIDHQKLKKIEMEIANELGNVTSK